MKKLVLSTLLLATAGLGFVSCNNGDYNATPASGINPLNPTGGLNYNFDWGGDDPMSAEINGNSWKADDARMFENPFDNRQYVVAGYKYGGDTAQMAITLLKNVEAGKVYYVFHDNTENTAYYASNISDDNQYYYSGNTSVGEVHIQEADATHIKGLFMFLAKSDGTGQYVNVQKGYFNVLKP